MFIVMHGFVFLYILIGKKDRLDKNIDHACNSFSTNTF